MKATETNDANDRESIERQAATDGGIIVAGDEGAILEDQDAVDGRPEDCSCGDWNAGSGLACWPCYREGFETPAPGVGEGDR